MYCTFAELNIFVHKKKEEDDKETPHSVHSNLYITDHGKSVCLHTTNSKNKSKEQQSHHHS
jgi:hypothetical protein